MDDHGHEVAKIDAAADQPHPRTATEHRRGHQQRRAQRLNDLMAEALEEPNPMRANLKAATAQLLDIGYRMGDEIVANMDARPAKPKAQQEKAGTVSTFMLVHRQVTRYIQLEQQWPADKPAGNQAGSPSADSDEDE